MTWQASSAWKERLMGKILARACAGFALLASATSASAEGAWVAWEHMLTGNSSAPFGSEWQPSGAFKTKQQCESFAKVLAEKTRNQPPYRSGFTPLREYVCLRDTVDPRGSKGAK
jgi:hypothetical protein